LALYQANLVASLLASLGVAAEIKVIKTAGDKIDNLSFDKMEGKGFFTKELEDALLSRDIDLAVHSLKDLSTQLPDGLKIGAYCSPEDPSELLLVRPECYDPRQRLSIKSGSRIGTSSVRRQAQIAFFRPDLKIETLRGNVPTRIDKLRDGKYDAILIAKAGVNRLMLGTSDLRSVTLDPFEFIPAPGQGILAIEIRNNDSDVESAVSRLNEESAEKTAQLERGLLARFHGGCQLPLAVTSKRRGNRFILRAFLGKRLGESWGPPARFSGEGDSIDRLIEDAFHSLIKESPSSSSSQGRAEPVHSTYKKKVLITRSEEDSSRLFEDSSIDIEVVFFPVFTITPSYDASEVERVLSGLDNFDWVIFASKNSVRIFFDRLRERGTMLPPILKIAAVGQKTKESLESHGIAVAFVPEIEDSSGLVDELPRVMGDSPKSILLPQGEEAPDTIENGLRALGHSVVRLDIYSTHPTEAANLPDIDVADIDFFIFTSPLSVSYFKDLGYDLPSGPWLSAIGQPTSEALARQFRKPDFVPAKADLKTIVDKIEERIRNAE
jgi:hydroxymethylbilane synthase